MDFEEFRENLMEDLRDQIYQRTGNDCTVEATNVAKLQNAGYEESRSFYLIFRAMFSDILFVPGSANTKTT